MDSKRIYIQMMTENIATVGQVISYIEIGQK
jgi:hypothetical protein